MQATEDRRFETLDVDKTLFAYVPLSRLTPREREVAWLVGRGYTNREIAAALVITEGSAHVHVGRVLNKLGFHTRSRVAAWVVSQGAHFATADARL